MTISYKGGRCALTERVDFSETMGAVLQGSRASLRNIVGRHTDATQFIELHNIMLLPLHSVGANVLKVVTS